MRRSCVVVQSVARQRTVRQKFKECWDVCICLQRYWRGASCRRDYVRSLAAVTSLQSMMRRRQTMARYCSVRSACVVIQAVSRSIVVQRRHRHLRDAALCVQGHWRGSQENR
jgi:myosin heavy subunit